MGTVKAKRHPAAGFTLVELLTVLTIIVILVTILLPVVSKMRRAAWVAATQAEIQAISGAIERYRQTFSVYPGPLPVAQLYPNGSTLVDTANTAIGNISGTENLVLGLMGGIKPGAVAGQFIFDRALVGTGPRTLGGMPKKNDPFIDGVPLTQRPDTIPTDPKYGDFSDGSGECRDSVIPEILDKFPNGAMPLLYLRAHVGSSGVISNVGIDATGAVMNAAGVPLGATQYDIREILPYTFVDTNGRYIGEGKTVKLSDYTSPPATPGVLPHGLVTIDPTKSLDKNGPGGVGAYVYPYDAFPYFVNRAITPTVPANPNGTGTPKQKDGFILIAAGADRVYGTVDDITSFGNVNE